MLILTIPHSGLEVKGLPQQMNSFLLARLYKDCLDCADLYVDKLFSYEKARRIVFPVSRMCVDVERYADDKKEIMAKYGRGVCYTVLNDGKTVYRNSFDTHLMEDYLNYHKDLDNLCKWYKLREDEPFIIDCHSFNQKPFSFDLCQDIKERDVDICFGFNEELPKELKDILENWCKDCAYSFSYNKPYSGAMTCPSCNNSLMIEVNKRVYLCGDNITPKADFYKVNNNMNRLIKYIDEWWIKHNKIGELK